MPINPDDYGTMNGERVLKAAILEYNKNGGK